jgi:TnpA family transposase
MPRMNIISKEEQDHFDSPVSIKEFKQKKLFDFPDYILEEAKQLREPHNRIYFLLASSSFKNSKKLFTPNKFITEDIVFIATLLRIELSQVDLAKCKKASIARYHKMILGHYGYKGFDKGSEEELIRFIKGLISNQAKLKLIFWESVDWLIANRIVVPSYFQLAEIILKSSKEHKRKLTKIIQAEMTMEIKLLIDGLFEQKGESSCSPYKLTLLKKFSQSTKPTQVRERCSDLTSLLGLFQKISPILLKLNLSNEGLQYFSTSVIKSAIAQINQRSEEDRYIHVIAFIAHQYYRLQDNLIDTLLSSINGFENSIKRQYKDLCYESRMKSIDSEQSLRLLLKSIKEVTEGSLGADEKLSEITRLLGENSYDEVANKDDLLYEDLLEKQSIRLQNRIASIVKVIDFQSDKITPLIEAIAFFQKKDGIISKNAPLDFLKETERKSVLREGFRTSLYKIYLFLHIAQGIKSGQLNLQNSYKYRSLDGYLIDKQKWGKEKQSLISQANLSDFQEPQTILSSLKNALLNRYNSINHPIKLSQNSHLRIQKDLSFSIRTPALEEHDSEKLRPYFPEKHIISLPEVLATIQKQTNFLESFTHWQNQYPKKSSFNQKTLYAGIIGLGCSIGISKMSRISSQIGEHSLYNTVNWYFSLENIRSANDQIVSFMDKLELPNLYRRLDEKLHTASDGQKFEVRGESLNANHSFKYFGKNQGISVNSFIDERNFLWHSLVFSASERESAYVIDGLMHNEIIKSDIHSTDTHGYSEAIFATTHLLRISYAPRIKNLKKQRLYGFKEWDKETINSWKIKPSQSVSEALIIEQWDEILRFIVTIKLKESTASDIFRRLNSYSKQHRLYQALKAFGQIIKTDFILRYLDDVELRQAIEKQLNKVELANGLTRAVAVGNPREFVQTEKEEQEIAEACNRLIKNSIICWNYLYLTKKIIQFKDTEQKETLKRAIQTHSVLCWEHINLLGEYDFSDEKLNDSIGLSINQKSPIL